jgi:hypothetical protein
MPKRVYLGDDVWKTTFENGEVEFEIFYDDEENAALEADAAKGGLTVNELIKKRTLTGGPFFDSEPDIELPSLDSITAMVSSQIRGLQSIAKLISEMEHVAQDCPEVIAQIRIMQALITDSMTGYLETGLIST